jgi:hypothetical protein
MKREGQLFETHMKRVHGLEIDIDETGWEGVTLYHEEIDPVLIPTNYLKGLPDPLLFLTTSYDDREEQEWIFYIVTDNDDATNWLFAGILKEGILFDTIPLEGKGK